MHSKLSLNDTLTPRQGPGVHLDAYANSDPHRHRLKPTDAESSRHAESHTQLHAEVLRAIGHSYRYTTAVCSHTRMCTASSNYRPWQGDRLLTTCYILQTEIETQEGRITHLRSHSKLLPEPHFQMSGNIQMFNACSVCFI